MKSKLVVGYKEVWKKVAPSYDELLSELPSDACISMAIMILNELTSNSPHRDNQLRILNIIASKFTPEQRNQLFSHLQLLEEGMFKSDAFELFHKRYLLALLVKELRRNKQIDGFTNAIGKPFAFINAYLAVIDEEAAKDQHILDNVALDETHPFWQLQFLWTNYIRQFQFNEQLHALFELFKSASLLKYAFERWRDPLRNFLASFTMSTIGELLHSYRLIATAAAVYEPHTTYHRPLRVTVDDINKYPHLHSLCINQHIGNKRSSLRELKKHPLYQESSHSVKIIDPEFFYLNIYRAPYFQLKQFTPVKDTDDTDYNSIVAKEVIEKICFRTIFSMLCPPGITPRFDDDSKQAPDGYCRVNHVVFLVEMKAYVLSEKMSAEPNAKNISDYIHENFLKKASGKRNGAGQLVNQIENIFHNRFITDKEINSIDHKGFTIYPIVCHNDIHFSLAGINTYVSEYFLQELSPEIKAHFTIKNVTFINLQVLFDLAVKGQTLVSLARLIDHYWKKMAQRFDHFQSAQNTDNFTRFLTSFDEIYEHEYRFLFGEEQPEQKHRLMSEAGITQELMDAPV